MSYDEAGTPLPAPTDYDAYGRPTAYSAYGMNVTCAYDLRDRLTQYQATADSKERTVLHAYEGDRQVKVTANGLYYHTRKVLPEGETASREDEREVVYIGTKENGTATEMAYGGEPKWDLVGDESADTPTEGESTAEDIKTVKYDSCGCLTYRLDKAEKRCYTYYYNRRHQPIYEKVEAWNEETNTAGDLIYYRRFTYSATGLLTSAYSSLTEKTTQYGYETNAGGYPYPDAALLSVTEDNTTSTVEIDGLGRTTCKTVKHGLKRIVKNDVGYAAGTSGDFAGAATARPTSYTTTDDTGTKTDTFTYDARGNITHIYRGGELLVRYSYDKFGQLIREDNVELYTTQLFTYDDHGNRLTKEQYHYTLGDYYTSDNRFFYQDYFYETAGWRDQLYQYGDHSETNTKYYNYRYDDLGNPTPGDLIGEDSIWAGTLLLQEKPGYPIYLYNDQGVRISKIGGQVTTTYTVDGTRILKEVRPDGDVLIYLYGKDGILGFTYNGTEYYYGKNLFGDITDIYDASGVKVAHYAYDAWGNHKIYNGSGMPMYSLDFIGVINPFRYRGYYYDIENGRYYLQSRYYDPTKGRFLNADSLAYLGADGELRGYNLYTYCGNNPVRNSYKRLNNRAIASNATSSLLAVLLTTSSLSNKAKPSVASGIHWKDKWFYTDDGNASISSGKDLIKNGGFNPNYSLGSQDYSIYKGWLYLDESENHALHISVGNASLFAGIKSEQQKFGVFFDMNVLTVGYDGKYIDAGVSVIGVGFIIGWENGIFVCKLDPPGWLGFEISINLVQILQDLFG